MPVDSRRFETLHVVILLAMSLHVAFAGVRVNLSLFALRLGASPFTVWVILSLLALLPTLFSVHAGRAIDRMGVRLPLLVGTSAVIAGIALSVAAPRLHVLFIVACLVGSGFMLVHIAANHLTGELGQGKDRARRFGLLALGFSTSGFLGPMVTGIAIDRIGHRFTFLLLGSFALLTLAILVGGRPATAKREARGPADDPRRLRDLFRNRTLRFVFLATGVLSPAWDLFMFAMPVHGSQIGLSATEIGTILGAFGGAIFCVRLAMPLLLPRVRE